MFKPPLEVHKAPRLLSTSDRTRQHCRLEVQGVTRFRVCVVDVDEFRLSMPFQRAYLSILWAHGMWASLAAEVVDQGGQPEKFALGQLIML